ncbi:hypothetical protein BHE74_00039760 [Ensete ventricosum]|nr:hypothetical protein BHE74_00039760 [Ensete ventricosum]
MLVLTLEELDLLTIIDNGAKAINREDFGKRGPLLGEVVGAIGVSEDGDRLLLKGTINFHSLRVRIAGSSMNRADDRLQFLLCILLLRLEIRIFRFGFFNGFNHQKSPLFAMVVVAPQLIAMPP